MLETLSDKSSQLRALMERIGQAITAVRLRGYDPVEIRLSLSDVALLYDEICRDRSLLSGGAKIYGVPAVDCSGRSCVAYGYMETMLI